MVSGKCWIYKRATLHVPGLPPKIVDYADGTEEFDCEVLNNGQYPIYEWKLPGEVIPIPLNIPRKNVDSIMRSGVIEYEDGELHWEFIFGKFRPYPKYFVNKFMESTPYILVILLLCFLLMRGRM